MLSLPRYAQINKQERHGQWFPKVSDSSERCKSPVPHKKNHALSVAFWLVLLQVWLLHSAAQVWVEQLNIIQDTVSRSQSPKDILRDFSGGIKVIFYKM